MKKKEEGPRRTRKEDHGSARIKKKRERGRGKQGKKQREEWAMGQRSAISSLPLLTLFLSSF